MQEVVCIRVLRSGEKPSKSTSSDSPADRSVIAALAILFVVNLLTHSAVAQVSSRTALRQAQVTRPLSPEIMAMHTSAKRATALAPTGVDLAVAAATTTTSTTFNSDQGPGPGPIGPGPGCNLFPPPPSVAAAVPLSHFGPPPCAPRPGLGGPAQVL